MRNPSPAPAPGSAVAWKAKVTPCCSKVGLKRGPWTPEEDEVLSSFIRREGEGKWRTLPKRAGLLRCGKSCRLRWMNYLRPSVKRGQIAPDEEDLILRLHRLLGNRWSLIAGRLPGRTDNEIKNYWNTHLSKKLISQGIDPRTHKPLNTDKPSSSLERDNNALASHVPATSLNPNANPNPNIQFQNACSSLGNENDGTNFNVHNPYDNYHYFDGSTLNHGGGWPSFDGPMVRGLPNSHVAGEAVEIGDVNFCTDDLFSSFLNSLINDEVLQQEPVNNGSICNSEQGIDLAAPPSDPLASEVLAFGNRAFWEPAFMCSTVFNEENYSVQPTNHMNN
ncbi:hypothetical protein Taro_017453 [Colocasia esculenta]|uniref:Uncharacterized protein n=1 Tax=Colocasia esculenta TaxID=4460 RepID=A0A843UG89_COLES|nr:hypothetical protein [Colocasia esculenta]